MSWRRTRFFCQHLLEQIKKTNNLWSLSWKKKSTDFYIWQPCLNRYSIKGMKSWEIYHKNGHCMIEPTLCHHLPAPGAWSLSVNSFRVLSLYFYSVCAMRLAPPFHCLLDEWQNQFELCCIYDWLLLLARIQEAGHERLISDFWNIPEHANVLKLYALFAARGREQRPDSFWES